MAERMARVIRGGFLDREFDVLFWQRQGDEAIFDAAWDMVVSAAEFKQSLREPNAEFRDLLRLLNEHRARYLIIGSYAVMKYTEPLFAEDIDIWIDQSADNAERAARALAGTRLNERVAVRVDVLTSIDAVSFEEAWTHRVETHLSGIPISVLSLEDLIRNKEAAGRDSDRIHLSRLRKYGKSER